MVANVSPLSAAQNKASAHQTAPAAPTGAASFASMLNNEIQSGTPATPPVPAKPPAAAPAANAATSAPNTSAPAAQSGTAKSAADSASSSTATPGTKKSDKADPKADPAQTDAAAASTAATAATLAAAASGAAAAATAAETTATATASATASTTSSADAASVTQFALADATRSDTAAVAAQSKASSDPAQSQFNALVANASGTPAPHDPNAKTGLTGVTDTGATTASGTAPASPVVTQTAVAANAGQVGINAGKNSAGQFNQTKSAYSEQATPGKAAPTPVPVSAPTAANQPASASPAQPVSASLPGATAPVENIKTANQDLSAQQLNAIAPVLTAPQNLDPTAPTSTIAPPVGSQGWDQAVGQKINWMVSGGQSSASLTLNPPELGPMQIVLNVNNQHASATFISHQPEVRAALEDAIPKLREMMQQSGIQLGQCDVSSQSRQQDFAQNQSGSGSNRSNAIPAGAGGNVSVMTSNTASSPRSGTGLVDTFV